MYFDEVILVAFNQSPEMKEIAFHNNININEWKGLNNTCQAIVEKTETVLSLPPYSYGFFLGIR